MLYKKNSSKTLDMELFKKPTSEYRGAPFWAWNTEINRDILNRQISYLKEMGFGGFHIHTRSGMATEYLGTEFMDLVKYCNDRASEEGMYTWLYDEDRWPSGSAGGFVTKTKAFRQKFLVFSVEKKEIVDKTVGTETASRYFLAAYDIALDNDGLLKSYKKIGYDDKAENIKRYAYVEFAEERGWFNNQTYVDTLSNEAMQSFIDITYEKYKSAVGKEFGKSVPAIFTDEPQFALKHALSDSMSDEEIRFPWTTDLADTFANTYNIDLLDYLPELFWDLENGELSAVRYYYHDHVCQRFVDSFVKQCGEWCEKENIFLTGHMVEEKTLKSQTWAVGETMRAYKYFGIPGIDILCDDIQLNTAKQAQSVVHQYKKTGMASELYGVTGWGFDFRGHKFQGDWQAAMGVTVRVPHLSWVSMKGSAKRDYPASINYQSPWYKEYSYVENYFARLNTVLTRGEPIVDVAVIHPIESFWLYYGPSDSNADIRNKFEENFKNLTEWLLTDMIDFDFICESLLPEQYQGSDNGKLSVGSMKYKTVIVPDCVTLRASTLKVLGEFSNNGGKIVFLGDCPQYVDAVKLPLAELLYNKSVQVSFDKYSILANLKDEKKISVYNEKHNSITDFIHCRRKDCNDEWLFIAHYRKDKEYDTPKAQTVTIEIEGVYIPLLYNALNGEVEPVEYENKNNKTYIYRDVYEFDSLLIRLNKTEGCHSFSLLPEIGEYELLRLNDDMEYQLSESNVYLMDMAQYCLDNGDWRGVEQITRIDDNCRQILKYPKADGADVQPWLLKKDDSAVGVKLKFDVTSECDLAECYIAGEDIDQLSVNGKVVPIMLSGYYVDECIKKYKLGKLSCGNNTIEIETKISKRISIENYFLLGDFGVSVRGVKKIITPKLQKIGFGNIVNQGLPFYGGNITYKNEFELQSDKSKIIIRVNRFRAPLIKVTIDGEESKTIAYSPYIAEFRDLKKGTHSLEITSFGNRENTFGPVHCCNYKEWYGPEKWYSYTDKFSAFGPERSEVFLTEQEWSYEYVLKEEGVLTAPIILCFE